MASGSNAKRNVLHGIGVGVALAIGRLVGIWVGSEIVGWALSGGLMALSAGLFMAPEPLRNWRRISAGVVVTAAVVPVIFYLFEQAE